MSSALKIRWSPETHRRITLWLIGGAETTKLAQLVAEDPEIVGHRLIWRQMQHVRFEVSPDDAETARTMLSEAWVHGMLGKDWTVQPPPRRPGRPTRSDEDEFQNYMVRSDYEDLIKLLRQHDVRKASEESRPAWEARLCGIIRQVWETSDISKEPDSVPSVPGADYLASVLVFREIPLPEERIRKWVEDIADAAGEGPMRDRVAYKLLAYRLNRTVGQVRGMVQAARRK